MTRGSEVTRQQTAPTALWWPPPAPQPSMPLMILGAAGPGGGGGGGQPCVDTVTQVTLSVFLFKARKSGCHRAHFLVCVSLRRQPDRTTQIYPLTTKTQGTPASAQREMGAGGGGGGVRGVEHNLDN